MIRFNKFETVVSSLLLCVCVAVVFVLDYTYLPQGDDTLYGTYIDSASGSVGHVSSVGDAFYRSFIADGHRPIAHFIARVFCGPWLRIYPFANALACFALLLLMIKNAYGKVMLSWHAVAVLAFVYLLVLCTGETSVFIAGSGNYLWPSVLTLLFLIVRKKVEEAGVAVLDLLWCLPFAVIAGWTQESFTLPIGFALFVYTILHIRELSWKKVLVYGAYAIGLLLLMLGNARLHDPTLASKPVGAFCGLGDLVKYFWSFKLLPVVALLFLLSSDKREFLKRNQFEFFVAAGSFLMVCFLGFYGERMIYLANIVGTIVALREFRGNRVVSALCCCLSVALAMLILSVNVVVARNAHETIDMYTRSVDGVCCMEKIGYPLWRFYFQDIPTWGEISACHQVSVSRYYAGVTNKVPVGLSRRLYDELYLKGTFCSETNRLPLKGVEAYTTDDVNAIVVPLAKGDTNDWASASYKVQYSGETGGFRRCLSKVLDKWNQWHYIEIRCEYPVKLKTTHGDYLLLGKKRMCDDRISDIQLICDEE